MVVGLSVTIFAEHYPSIATHEMILLSTGHKPRRPIIRIRR
jgi:hypothetical protein